MKILIPIILITLYSCQTSLPTERVRKGVSTVDALVVVHPTHGFDIKGEAKEAINFIANEFMRQGKPVFTLVETPQDLDSKPYLDYFPIIKKTKVIYSKNGENDLALKGTRFVVMGGYLKACLKSALIYLSKNYLKSQGRDITFFLPLPAIYGKGMKLELREWEKFNLHHWLPKDTNLRVIHQNKTLYKITDKSYRHSITLHFRGRGESPFFQERNN